MALCNRLHLKSRIVWIGQHCHTNEYRIILWTYNCHDSNLSRVCLRKDISDVTCVSVRSRVPAEREAILLAKMIVFFQTRRYCFLKNFFFEFKHHKSVLEEWKNNKNVTYRANKSMNFGTPFQLPTNSNWRQNYEIMQREKFFSVSCSIPFARINLQ